jgi:hypothetical protein
MISSSAASSSSGTPAATPTPGPANPIGVPVVPDGATPVTANGRI